MSKKRVIGIVLSVLGVALVGLAVYMIVSNMVRTGPTAGKITAYRPPFKNHGLLTVLTGFAGLGIFFTGIALAGFGKSE